MVFNELDPVAPLQMAVVNWLILEHFAQSLCQDVPMHDLDGEIDTFITPVGFIYFLFYIIFLWKWEPIRLIQIDLFPREVLVIYVHLLLG